MTFMFTTSRSRRLSATDVVEFQNKLHKHRKKCFTSCCISSFKLLWRVPEIHRINRYVAANYRRRIFSIYCTYNFMKVLFWRLQNKRLEPRLTALSGFSAANKTQAVLYNEQIQLGVFKKTTTGDQLNNPDFLNQAGGKMSNSTSIDSKGLHWMSQYKTNRC